MGYTQAEILQTVAMTEMEHLDVRTVTLGLNLLDCSSDSINTIAQKAGDKIRTVAARLVRTIDEIGDEFGIRVANRSEERRVGEEGRAGGRSDGEKKDS